MFRRHRHRSTSTPLTNRLTGHWVVISVIRHRLPARHQRLGQSLPAPGFVTVIVKMMMMRCAACYYGVERLLSRMR